MTNTIEDTFHLDSRIRARMIDRGALSKEAEAKHLADLPDLDGQQEAIDLQQPAVSVLGGADEK